MGTKVSIASGEDRLARIDEMLQQLINEVEESRNNNSLESFQSYREEYFAKCRDIFDVSE